MKSWEKDESNGPPELVKLIDNELDSSCGWIDPAGNFYPCQYGGHNDKMDQIIEAGYDTTLNDCETTWLKSVALWSGNHVFLSQAQRLTPRQKITVQNLVIKHDLLPVGQWTNCGLSVLVRESENRVTFPNRRGSES